MLETILCVFLIFLSTKTILDIVKTSFEIEDLKNKIRNEDE